MATKANDLVSREIDDLVATAEKLSRDAARSGNGLGPERIEELSGVAARGGQLIRRLYGLMSQYSESWAKVLATDYFTAIHSNHYEHVSEMVGILRGVQHDVRSGLIRNLRGLLQAEVFADFLEMAEHLLTQGYKDAAAVLLGAVLEDVLRKVAAAHEVPVVSSSGKPLTIDPINAGLAKEGVYNALVQKQITSWANLRNDAAHGHFEKYDAAQVQQMLHFVQKFSADHL
jgi:hypothetical protein